VLVGVAVALLLAWAAVSPLILPAATPAPGPASPGAPASPVVGVVTKVDSSGLSSVNGFRLRLGDGSTLAFEIGTLENGDEFPPGHLAEHLATASPVEVFFRVENGALVVYRIQDAP